MSILNKYLFTPVPFVVVWLHFIRLIFDHFLGYNYRAVYVSKWSRLGLHVEVWPDASCGIIACVPAPKIGQWFGLCERQKADLVPFRRHSKLSILHPQYCSPRGSHEEISWGVVRPKLYGSGAPNPDRGARKNTATVCTCRDGFCYLHWGGKSYHLSYPCEKIWASILVTSLLIGSTWSILELLASSTDSGVVVIIRCPESGSALICNHNVDWNHVDIPLWIGSICWKRRWQFTELQRNCCDLQVEAAVKREAGARSGNAWKPLLLLVPLRLGLDAINPRYAETVQDMFKINHFIGAIGGRPNAAFYFVGTHDDDILYLDPHRTQTSVGTIDK